MANSAPTTKSPVSRRRVLSASLLLPVGLIGGSSLVASCGVLTGDAADTGEDPDKLLKEAVGNEIALIQAIGAANYSGNKALAKELNALTAIHTEHALALDANAVVGATPSAATKISPTSALSKVRAAQRNAMKRQKALALQAGGEDLAFKLAIISASEAQCSAHVARIQP